MMSYGQEGTFVGLTEKSPPFDRTTIDGDQTYSRVAANQMIPSIYLSPKVTPMDTAIEVINLTVFEVYDVYETTLLHETVVTEISKSWNEDYLGNVSGIGISELTEIISNVYRTQKIRMEL